ncbi:hypothetical protein KCU81_g8508, partial [Aureobasidium melanogenum]
MCQMVQAAINKIELDVFGFRDLNLKLIDFANSSCLEIDEDTELDKTKRKTYSSRDSHVVTHRSTNLPFNCLCMAERTGCPVFS